MARYWRARELNEQWRTWTMIRLKAKHKHLILETPRFVFQYVSLRIISHYLESGIPVGIT